MKRIAEGVTPEPIEIRDYGGAAVAMSEKLQQAMIMLRGNKSPSHDTLDRVMGTLGMAAGIATTLALVLKGVPVPEQDEPEESLAPQFRDDRLRAGRLLRITEDREPFPMTVDAPVVAGGTGWMVRLPRGVRLGDEQPMEHLSESDMLFVDEVWKLLGESGHPATREQVLRKLKSRLNPENRGFNDVFRANVVALRKLWDEGDSTRTMIRNNNPRLHELIRRILDQLAGVTE